MARKLLTAELVEWKLVIGVATSLSLRKPSHPELRYIDWNGDVPFLLDSPEILESFVKKFAPDSSYKKNLAPSFANYYCALKEACDLA